MFVCLLISALFLGANDTYAGDTISAADTVSDAIAGLMRKYLK